MRSAEKNSNLLPGSIAPIDFFAPRIAASPFKYGSLVIDIERGRVRIVGLSAGKKRANCKPPFQDGAHSEETSCE